MLTIAGNQHPDLAAAIRQHPLIGRLSGTVAVGLDSARPWPRTAPRPRIAVLHDVTTLSRAQRAHLALADGIVLSRSTQVLPAVMAAATPATVLAAADSSPTPFLRGSTPVEAGEAWAQVAMHPTLATALDGGARDELADVIAGLVVELILATEG